MPPQQPRPPRDPCLNACRWGLSSSAGAKRMSPAGTGASRLAIGPQQFMPAVEPTPCLMHVQVTLHPISTAHTCTHPCGCSAAHRGGGTGTALRLGSGWHPPVSPPPLHTKRAHNSREHGGGRPDQAGGRSAGALGLGAAPPNDSRSVPRTKHRQSPGWREPQAASAAQPRRAKPRQPRQCCCLRQHGSGSDSGHTDQSGSARAAHPGSQWVCRAAGGRGAAGRRQACEPPVGR